MEATIIEDQNVETLSKGLGESVEEELKTIGVERGQFQKEALPDVSGLTTP